MESSGFNFGSTGSEELIARRPDSEMPEFDITAMVDLVFMMNIYFLVTFVTVAMGELNLPSARHCTALDGETAVIVTVARSLDGKSVVVYIGDGTKTDPIKDPAEQDKRVHEAVEQGMGEGKKNVLIKAERKVRMADYFRIALAASVEGMKLHDAVLEKDK